MANWGILWRLESAWSKRSTHVFTVHASERTGRLFAGPMADNKYIPLNLDFTFSNRVPHKIEREFELKDTHLRVEIEIDRERNGVIFRFVRKWDVRRRAPKTNDPNAVPEQIIDVSPSESFSEEEIEYVRNNYIHRIGDALSVYVPLATLLLSWGSLWQLAILGCVCGMATYVVAWNTLERHRLDDIIAAKQRGRQHSQELFNDQLRLFSWWKSLSGVAFEDAVAHILTVQGFDVEQTPRSNDKGVDLLLRKDGRKILVQCKAYSSSVGVGTLRELVGTKVQFEDADEIWLVALHGFSRTAKEFATRHGVVLYSVAEQFLNIPNHAELKVLGAKGISIGSPGFRRRKRQSLADKTAKRLNNFR